MSQPPSYPAPGPWTTPNAHQMIPKPRRSLAGALVATALMVLPTFVVVFFAAYVLGSFVDALESTARDTTTDVTGDRVTDAEVMRFALASGGVLAGAHLVLAAGALLLLRIGDTFASWHPALQALTVWALTVVLVPLALFALGVFV